MENYDTVVAALQGLKAKGYTLDFNIFFDTIKCEEHNHCLVPSEFEITEVHRFEGNTDPSDEAVVYAIQSVDGKKGVLVNGYGISADAMSSEMAKKLSINRN